MSGMICCGKTMDVEKIRIKYDSSVNGEGIKEVVTWEIRAKCADCGRSSYGHHGVEDGEFVRLGISLDFRVALAQLSDWVNHNDHCAIRKVK